jgi:hypothetical protein
MASSSGSTLLLLPTCRPPQRCSRRLRLLLRLLLLR